MNSEKFVCRECGKVISKRMKRRHKERCWPRSPVIQNWLNLLFAPIVDLQEGFIEVNGFAKDVDSGNILLVLNRIPFGFICVTSNPNTVKMSQTGWATILKIFEDMMIFFWIELYFLKLFNPVFFERVVEAINGWYVNE